jgi:hypothetical protein
MTARVVIRVRLGTSEQRVWFSGNFPNGLRKTAQRVARRAEKPAKCAVKSSFSAHDDAA